MSQSRRLLQYQAKVNRVDDILEPTNHNDSDLRVVTVLSILYIISLMDRINLSTAAIAGLNKELELQIGTRYSVIILNFFAAYTVFQPLGTVLTRKFVFLSSIVLAWGIVMIGNGSVHSWKKLAGPCVLIG